MELSPDSSCVFCGLTETQAATGDLAEYGMGIIRGLPVCGWICQSCPLPWYGQGTDPDPDPAVFMLLSSRPGEPPYWILRRKVDISPADQLH